MKIFRTKCFSGTAAASKNLVNDFSYSMRKLFVCFVSFIVIFAPMHLDADKNIALTVHFISIGQGDAELIECDGKVMLIDAGKYSDRAKLAAYLEKEGIDYIDYVFITHPDEDHYGGFRYVAENYEIGTAFVSAMGVEKVNKSGYTSVINTWSDKVKTPAAGDKFDFGGAEVTILANKDYGETNASSIQFMIDTGNIEFFFTGDGTTKTEADALSFAKANSIDIDVEVLKVGHHGSNTSSSLEFLKAVKPEYSVIECGLDNQYGLPTQTILDRLFSVNTKIYRTDLDGDIVFTTDGIRLYNSIEGTPSQTPSPVAPTPIPVLAPNSETSNNSPNLVSMFFGFGKLTIKMALKIFG